MRVTCHEPILKEGAFLYLSPAPRNGHNHPHTTPPSCGCSPPCSSFNAVVVGIKQAAIGLN